MATETLPQIVLTESGWSLFVQIAVAFGTILVAILAIWGDWFRAKLAYPKLELAPHNLRGTVINLGNGEKRIYYYLKVINHRQWVIAKNCHVLLKSLYRRDPNNQYSPVPIPFPYHFVWSPEGFIPPFINLTSENVVDFGYIAEKEVYFKPACYAYAINKTDCFVGKDKSLRYCLEIVADGYVGKRDYIFEVAWDGGWSDNLDDMSKHLTIREIENCVMPS